MSTTIKVWGEIKLLLRSMTGIEKIVHGLVWFSGLLIINIPAFALTFGIFRSDDLSLLVPSLFGAAINASIFYGVASMVLRLIRQNVTKLLTQSVIWFVLLTLIESLADLIFYFGYYDYMSSAIVFDEVIGSFLLNALFFYIPGVVYGIIKMGVANEETTVERILIKDGNKSIFVSADELLFVEGEGNYCAYQTVKEKILQRVSLAKLENSLPPQFIRCHKSFIVNKNLIEKQTAKEFTLQSFKIPIGRKYAEKVRV